MKAGGVGPGPARTGRRAVGWTLSLTLVLTAAGTLTGCRPPADPAVPLTIAATATVAEPTPWAPTLADLAVSHAMRAKAPGDGTVSVVVATNPEVKRVDLTPMRDKHEVEQDRALRRDKARKRVAELESTLSAAAPVADGLDLLSTYRRAVQVTGEGGRIILVSSGVQTADPLDLRVVGWEFDPTAVAADLAGRGLVPDARGRTVEFLGLGIAYGTQPGLPLPHAHRVIALWQAVCTASGAASCVVHDDDVPLLPSASARPVPVVPVQAPATECRGRFLVPAEIAFAPDDDALRDGADEYLRPIADELRRCPADRLVRITGHTARDGNAPSGFALSERRAHAVHARLVELGAPPGIFGTVEGVGSTRPVLDNMPGGVFSEELARKNRRVEIDITVRTAT